MEYTIVPYLLKRQSKNMCVSYNLSRTLWGYKSINIQI